MSWKQTVYSSINNVEQSTSQKRNQKEVYASIYMKYKEVSRSLICLHFACSLRANVYISHLSILVKRNKVRLPMIMALWK